MKSLEVNEEKSMAKQDEYENTIADLTQRLSQAESRAEFAERAVQKLIKEVDRLEGKFFERFVLSLFRTCLTVEFRSSRSTFARKREIQGDHR